MSDKGKLRLLHKKELEEKRCSDCLFIDSFNRAKKADNVITDYDFFYLGIVPNLDGRKLLILDEAHNLERKMQHLF